MKFFVHRLGRRAHPGHLPRLSCGNCAALGLLALLCITAPRASAATLLFDNLRAFGTRLDVGDPSLSPTNQSGQIIDGPKDIAVADLDGDTRPDLAIANKDGSVTIYLGTNGGAFGPPAHLHTGGGELRGIACADFTGDGRSRRRRPARPRRHGRKPVGRPQQPAIDHQAAVAAAGRAFGG